MTEGALSTAQAPALGLRPSLRLAGALALLVVAFRVFDTILAGIYPLPVWGFQVVNGLVLGGVYALVALGYTLVYGILFMINFAHGEVLMIGAYSGFFTMQALGRAGVVERQPLIAVLVALLVGMLSSAIAGVALERVAYRPLRTAPRLVPLITAIGASIFLQNAALLMFGPSIKVYPRLALLGGGWQIGQFFLSRLAVAIVLLSVILMIALYLLIRYTTIGRAMRAVAEDKQTAALMGIDVDRTIVSTFVLGSLLAGAAGVMLGFYNNQVNHVIGFMPGIKAFTAAVLGGIGNIPGAMLGGIFLGLAEALGPTALNIPSEYKDIIAFSLLVLVLIFRPTGLLGEILSERRA